MSKAQETVLEINLNSLTHNYTFLRSRLSPGIKFMGVVKAFAYGSDSVEISKKLEEIGVDYLAIAYAEEGVTLRNSGIMLPILVLHSQMVSFHTIIDRCLEPAMYSKRILREFIETAEKCGQKNYPVHLKFNTGLNRLGFNESEVTEVLQILKKTDAIKVASIFSHLAASEDLNEREFTLNQIASFSKIASEVEKGLSYKPFKHLANTSGILNYPEAHFDMVRSGIGLYGFGNETQYDEKLLPIATLKTNISQIHEIKANQSVGYNRAFKADTTMITATLPIGHADGIGRIYGNGKGIVSVHGKPAPIIGNTCMDMIMIDITGIDCAEGDEVILFGPEAKANSFAERAKTISYELLTGISQRVKRKIITT
tara:strand:- start:39003 stop:40112 length:1110 start_codon:yes stop_codon:yes gene_type:complete